MGTYTPQEFMDEFGGLPDRDDLSCAPDWRSAIDDERKAAKEERVSEHVVLYTGPGECVYVGWATAGKLLFNGRAVPMSASTVDVIRLGHEYAIDDYLVADALAGERP
jgi:hypothetical protein